MLKTVFAELKELVVSKDVVGLFCGDLVVPGLLFCSFPIPEPSFVGLLGDLPFPTSLRCLSAGFVRMDSGGAAPGADTWLKRFARSFTVPGGLEDGRSTGLDRMLLRPLLPRLECAGPEALRNFPLEGDREKERCAEVRLALPAAAACAA